MADEVQIDSLSVAIEQSANDSSDSLARLAKNLGELKSAVSGLRLTSTVNGLRGIADATSKLDRDKVAALGELGGALAKISGAGKISSSFAKQIAGIGAAIDGLGDIDAAKLTGLADALSPLAALDRAKLTSYINQLKQLPEVAEALDGMDMDGFAASIRRAADAMKPLADEMEKVSNGFSALPTKIQRIIRENDRLTASTRKGASGWRSFWKEVWGGSNRRSHSIVRELLGFTSATAVFFKVRDTLVDANRSAMDYTENLNLFSVAMGEYAEEAYDYAKEVESVLGIDNKEWIRHQGTLMDMARGYGVASDAAYTMSKALTQLTYDFMSFYNIESFSESANKMRSALAGEIEPIRALGKDLSVASLQLMATKLGIDENVDAMTQAEKAVLRTIVLLDRSGTAAGDLARTLDDPANQFRILNAQMTLFARSVGDLMLPLVKEVLPYLTATFRVMRMITKEFARLAGIELPDINTEVSTEQTESLGDALGEAADEAERLFQLSFDELNILGSQAGAGNNDSMDKLVEEMERLAAIQDAAFMKDVEDSVAGITDELVDWLTKGQGIETWVGNIWGKFEDINEFVGNIAQALGLWDFPEKVWTVLQNFGLEVENVGIRFGGSELDGIEGEDHLKENVLGGALGAALLGGGALALLGGKGGARALTFGLGLALSVGAIDMLYDGATAYGDTSTSNGLYQAVKGAFEAGLLGTGLSLLSGGGLKFALRLGLTVSSVILAYDGITGLYDSTTENDLYATVKTGISAALAGAQLGLLSGKGLSFTLSLSLGITAVSLGFAGLKMLFDGSEENDLLAAATNAVSVALGGVALTRFTGKSLTYNFPLILGLSSLTFSLSLSQSVANADSFREALVPITQQVLANALGGMALALKFGGTAAGYMAWTLPLTLLLDVSFMLDKMGVYDKLGKELQHGLTRAEESIKEAAAEIIPTDIIGDNIVQTVINGVNVAGEIAGSAINAAVEGMKGLVEVTYPTLDTVAEGAKEKAATVGKNVVEGTANGITESKDTVETATKGLADSAMLGITTTLGIHSPSTVFWDYGLNIDEGLANGVTDNMTIVTFAFDSVWQSIQSGFSSFASSMISDAQNFISTIDSILSSVSYGGGFSTPAISAARIPAFAGGGIVEDGLFMANSSELVGRFANGRTAVANNEQITSAIESAVYRATIAANRASGGRGNGGNVYLDGKKVGRILNTLSAEEQRRSGEVEIPTGGGF